VDDLGDADFKVGESLPGIARTLLGSLRLLEVLKADDCLPCSGNRSAWGSDRLVHRPSLLDPYAPGMHLDRAAFERGLLSAVLAAGADALPGRFVRSDSVGATWILTVRAKGGIQRVRCKWVVDATGRRSAFATSRSVMRVGADRQVGVVGLFSHRADDANRSVTLEAGPYGWWYSAPVPRGRRVVIYFTDPDLLRVTGVGSTEGFGSLARRTHHIRIFVSGEALFPNPKVVLASTSRLQKPAGEGWVAAGDAADALDPLASVGILDAIKGARGAVGVILADGGGRESYCSVVVGGHERNVTLRRAYYQMERRWPQSPFWSRRTMGD